MRISENKIRRIVSEEIERNLNEGLLSFLADMFGSFFKDSAKTQEKVAQSTVDKSETASNTQVQKVAKDLGSSAKDYESLDPKNKEDMMVWSYTNSKILPKFMFKILISAQELVQAKKIFATGKEDDESKQNTKSMGTLLGYSAGLAGQLSKHIKSVGELEAEIMKKSKGPKEFFAQIVAVQKLSEIISKEVVNVMSQSLKDWPDDVEPFDVEDTKQTADKFKKAMSALIEKFKSEISTIKDEKKESIMRTRPLQVERVMRRVLVEGFVEYNSLSDSELLKYVSTGDSLAKEEYQKRIDDDSYLAEVDEIPLPSRRHRFFEVDKK